MKATRVHEVVTLIAIFGLWYVATCHTCSTARDFPDPQRVYSAFRATYPDILGHAFATLTRGILGFLAGSFTGLLCGLLMSYNRFAFWILDPIVESVRPAPVIAASPFLILWLGTGDLPQMLLIIASCGSILAVDVFHAVKNIPPILIRASQTLGAKKFAIYRTIILPAIFPHIIGALRVISAISFTVTIAAELLGAQLGLGFTISVARRSLETPTIFMAVLIVGLFARLTDLLIQSIGFRVTRWFESSSQLLAI